MTRAWFRKLALFGLTGILVVAAGCGSSSTSETASSSNGSGGGSTTPASNVQPISINAGPATAPPINTIYVDGAFTSVTLCVPGSATSCQTISGILVDTGSSGLRILSSALTLSLPQQTDSGTNPIAECFPFVDGVTWGPVQTADLTMAGELAKSLPIQVLGSPSFPTVPAGCSSLGVPEDDLANLGANGILGIGNFAQDCGGGCTLAGSSNPGFYYSCPTSGCVVTEESAQNQVPNPVTLFASDNNGTLIQLPAVTGNEASLSGSLIFGIGTQSNNALGSATVYAMNPSTGNFSTTYKGVSYQGEAFLDSGSNGIYFLDSTTTGIPACASLTFWYCPSSTESLTATNQGTNGATGTVNFVVNNAQTATSGTAAVIYGLAGPMAGQFDWGLPFFFGRNVFTAIEGASTPGGTGPYWAY